MSVDALQVKPPLSVAVNQKQQHKYETSILVLEVLQLSVFMSFYFFLFLIGRKLQNH